MIREVQLEGFKSFFQQTIEFGKLTVLTGLNSSGKSSVIQALRMAKRMCDKHNCLLPGYGGFKELENKAYGGRMYIAVRDDDNHSFEIVENGAVPAFSGKYPTLLYISASRFGPQVNIPVYANDTEPDELGQNVLKTIHEYHDHAVNKILKREGTEGNTFRFVLDSWLKVISPSMKFDYKIDEKADMSYTTYNGHRAKNVGFGLSYTLPVITSLLLGTIIPNSLVIIENPEAHLHAKAQTLMAELIAKCVEAGAQVIVETHSDHLFDGLRIYTKEHEDFAEKMKCYWFELNEEGHTIPVEIEVNKKGRIATLDIPDGFCDQFEFNAKKLLFGR